MNARERRLLLILGVVVGLGGGSILVYQWFWRPFQEYRTAAKKLAGEIERKEDEVFAILKDRPLLEKYRAWSLPAGVDRSSAEYGTYLQAVVTQAKLTDVYFQSPTVTEQKAPAGPPGAAAAAAKKPGHTTLTFQVRAKGELENVVKALETLRKTPLAHRVKALTLDRVDTSSKSNNPKLNVNFTIDALIVNQSAGRPDNLLGFDSRLFALEGLSALQRGPTGIATLPWVVGPTGPVAQRQWLKEQGDRNYADIARRNIFVGASPPEVLVEEDDPDAGLEVKEFVRLDTTDVDGKQAYLRNYLHKAGPIRLKSVPRSGYDTFRITNEDRSKTLLRAKVLRIDQRDVFFQVGEDVYGIHIGQTIAEAMRRPLSDDEMELRELTALFDDEWALEEIETKQAGGTRKGQTGKKGPSGQKGPGGQFGGKKTFGGMRPPGGFGPMR